MPGVTKKNKVKTTKKSTPDKPVKKFVSESVSITSIGARQQKAAL